MSVEKENVVMQDDYAAFSDGIMRAERILAERELTASKMCECRRLEG
ncbi:hypothetical protein [Acidiphilium sp.]|jgi:hypothetical protein|nr:hypothetical protein [Acidiphilium sp.]HQT62621.1 hypothetical protein [Acidiphilium sp.]